MSLTRRSILRAAIAGAMLGASRILPVPDFPRAAWPTFAGISIDSNLMFDDMPLMQNWKTGEVYLPDRFVPPEPWA